jgi:hypothetical protein
MHKLLTGELYEGLRWRKRRRERARVIHWPRALSMAAMARSMVPYDDLGDNDARLELDWTGRKFYSPSPNTSQLAARMKARRTLRSLGARPSQPKRLLRRSRQGGWKVFGEFCKDTSELCSEELHCLSKGIMGGDFPTSLPPIINPLNLLLGLYAHLAVIGRLNQTAGH